MRMALKHRKEVKEQLGRNEDMVRSLYQDMQAIAKPIEWTIVGEDAEEHEDYTAKPSILGVLNAD